MKTRMLYSIHATILVISIVCFFPRELSMSIVKPFYVLDVNECSENLNICPDGVCQNFMGGYQCACYRGFTPTDDMTNCLGKLPFDTYQNLYFFTLFTLSKIRYVKFLSRRLTLFYSWKRQTILMNKKKGFWLLQN